MMKNCLKIYIIVAEEIMNIKNIQEKKANFNLKA